MNVLIVILDILLQRAPYYNDAAMVNVLAEKGYISSYISASAITDIFYIARKELKGRNKAIKLLKNILKTTRIASVTENNIHEALNLEWEDFEDSVQYVAGKNILANYIITRNPHDFANSKIKVVSPNVFLSQFK
jgi:hypothetical protein